MQLRFSSHIMHPLLPLSLFTALYLIAAAAFAFTMVNWEFVLYIAVVLVLAALVWLLHRRVHLHMASLWALSLWGLLHMAGGLIPVPEHFPIGGPKAVLYSLWLIPEVLKYDQLVHAYGFAVATWVVWQSLHAIAPRTNPTMGILTICVLGGMGLGALNEVIEFATVLLIPNTNVGGYENTGWDLIFNLIGCIAAAAILRLRYPRPSPSPAGF